MQQRTSQAHQLLLEQQKRVGPLGPDGHCIIVQVDHADGASYAGTRLYTHVSGPQISAVHVETCGGAARPDAAFFPAGVDSSRASLVSRARFPGRASSGTPAGRCVDEHALRRWEDIDVLPQLTRLLSSLFGTIIAADSRSGFGITISVGVVVDMGVLLIVADICTGPDCRPIDVYA
jgi:hypothetical protein